MLLKLLYKVEKEGTLSNSFLKPVLPGYQNWIGTQQKLKIID
jgi:hypothetical protein